MIVLSLEGLSAADVTERPDVVADVLAERMDDIMRLREAAIAGEDFDGAPPGLIEDVLALDPTHVAVRLVPTASGGLSVEIGNVGEMA